MENDILRAYISENIVRAQDDNIPAAVSKFLDSSALSLATALAKRTSGNFVFWGGYPSAERVIMLCIPDYVPEDISPSEIFSQFSDDCPLKAVRLKKDRFSTLSHRDYLGSVMGLGLTRDSIGDITVRDDGCDIIALPSAARYIAENLTQVGRASVKAELISIDEIKAPEIKFEEISFTVASPRLDAVAGEIFSLSRSSACEAVAAGIIFLNDEQMTKPDKHISPGDKLVMRGKGRAIIGDSFFKTKKGRVRISARKSI